jgi:hypothetical protein
MLTKDKNAEVSGTTEADIYSIAGYPISFHQTIIFATCQKEFGFGLPLRPPVVYTWGV